VERGIAYVKGNSLKAKKFGSLADQNNHLREWEKSVADTRIHGTTRQQVEKLFLIEKSHLQALPPDLFVSYREFIRRVSRDSFVQVDKAYYQAPIEYIDRDVWAQVDGRSVRLFNQRRELIASHLPLSPGKFSHLLGVGGFDPKGVGARTAAQQWMSRASIIGPQAKLWAEATWSARGIEGVRSLMGFCQLQNKHSSQEIEQACAAANSRPSHRLSDLKIFLKLGSAAETQMSLGIEHQGEATASAGPSGERPAAHGSPHDANHPLIRDLYIYTDLITLLTSTQPTKQPEDQPEDQQRDQREGEESRQETDLITITTHLPSIA
jgi:hypothetical protein